MGVTQTLTMTESDLLAAVLDLAAVLKWRTAHFRPARTESGWRTAVSGDGKGFVDLVLVKDRVLFVELKSMTGRQSREQIEWMIDLRAAGADYRLWTPTDWTSGVIEKELRK